ncbi:hypothetical protein JRD95_00908 [Rickettsia parkeri]|nr:hypothetical protein JRD95_00908 [Rickettsia parkeri]
MIVNFLNLVIWRQELLTLIKSELFYVIIAWIPNRHCERTLVSVAISGIFPEIASSVTSYLPRNDDVYLLFFSVYPIALSNTSLLLFL